MGFSGIAQQRVSYVLVLPFFFSIASCETTLREKSVAPRPAFVMNFALFFVRLFCYVHTYTYMSLYLLLASSRRQIAVEHALVG